MKRDGRMEIGREEKFHRDTTEAYDLGRKGGSRIGKENIFDV